MPSDTPPAPGSAPQTSGSCLPAHQLYANIQQHRTKTSMCPAADLGLVRAQAQNNAEVSKLALCSAISGMQHQCLGAMASELEAVQNLWCSHAAVLIVLHQHKLWAADLHSSNQAALGIHERLRAVGSLNC